MKSYLTIIKIESKNKFDNLIFNEKSINKAIKRVAIACYHNYYKNEMSLLLQSKKYSKYLEEQSDLTILITEQTKKKKTWQNRKVINEDFINNWAKSFKEANDEYEKQIEEDLYYEQLGIIPPKIEKQIYHLINLEK